LNWFYWYNLD